MRMLVACCIMVVMAVAVVGVGGAQAQGLEAGDMAPAFSLPGTDGKTHSLSDYAGTPVVLAWFPKAFTGG
ncbi:MAG: redoxin domain-containing protein [bacterium]